MILYLALSAPLPGDEIVLLDGKKISGTIVGMEKGSFRVETDFGVALVRKEKVARIEITPGRPAETSAGGTGRLPEAPAAGKPAPVAARSTTIQERRPPGGRIQEHVEGNTYINDTFGFEMFKPPTWKVLENAARSVPSAVAAMSTEDESTMLLVGSVLFDGPTSAYASVLDSSIKRLYGDYQRESEDQVMVAGRPAIRRSFHGLADGRAWYGTVVNLADGQVHYGIIAVTSEEAHQFKSSVMGKMIASFRFR